MLKLDKIIKNNKISDNITKNIKLSINYCKVMLFAAAGNVSKRGGSYVCNMWRCQSEW